MLLLLLDYVVLRALWKIDVHLISTLVNKSLYYYLPSWQTIEPHVVFLRKCEHMAYRYSNH